MRDFIPLFHKLAALVACSETVDAASLQRCLDVECAAAAITKTRNGEFILSGGRIAVIPGLVDILVAVAPRRSIVIAPETKGAAGVFRYPPNIAGGEIVESKTGLGFVWRAPLNGATVGLSANLPDRTSQTIYCDANSS